MTTQGSGPTPAGGSPAPEPATDFARVEDGFERLWTPHRMAYILGDKATEEAGHGCPFCSAPGKSDEEGLIVHRGEHCYVVMNLFPYNPGHVLVCPYRHVSLYIDLTDEETQEFTELTKQAVRALQTASGAARLQPRDEPGCCRGGRRGRPPAPAHRSAVERRLELPAHRRADQGTARAHRGDAQAPRRQLDLSREGRLRPGEPERGRGSVRCPHHAQQTPPRDDDQDPESRRPPLPPVGHQSRRRDRRQIGRAHV